MAFTELDPRSLTENPFQLIGDEWALLSAGSTDHCNTMTISWGAMGIIWGAPAVTCYVRQTRYTKEFIDNGELFTLSFFGDEERDALALCGRVSGRDQDKITDAGLTVMDCDGVAAFEEARLVLVCRKQFAQFMDAESFVDKDALDRWYGDHDYHTMYIGKIEKVLVQQ